MAWIYLLLAGLCEVAWTTAMKHSSGFTKLAPSLMTVAAVGMGYFFLSLALKEVPLGTAYAVWVGVGAVGVALVGILFFGESSAIMRLLCLGLIVAGIVGLKLSAD